MLLHCAQCHIHIICDLRIRPSPVCQHGNRKLCCGQVIGNIFFCDWIMDPTPAIAKLISNLNDLLLVFRVL